MRESVKFTNVGVEERGGEITLRGTLSADSLDNILDDTYQREEVSGSSADDLESALEAGAKIPDIILGMRGENYSTRGDDHYLNDPVYVIDGLQRLTAARRLRARGGKPNLGAQVHLNTTREQERELFHVLNVKRLKVSRNILIRNKSEDFSFIAALIAATLDSTHPLYNRITWDQRAKSGHLLSATTILKILGALHAHLGHTKTVSVDDLIPKLQEVSDKIGKKLFMENGRAFFQLISDCWGIATITYKEGACWVKPNFLRCLADLLSRNNASPVVWKGTKLLVDPKLQKRLKAFNVNDPTVVHLASSSGKAREHLLTLMEDHLRSGRAGHKRPVPAPTQGTFFGAPR